MYKIRYETPEGIETMNAARHYKNEDGMTVINYYPDASEWATEENVVGLEERRKHIPTSRIIDIDEKP